jgi:hypothetical protein
MEPRSQRALAPHPIEDLHSVPAGTAPAIARAMRALGTIATATTLLAACGHKDHAREEPDLMSEASRCKTEACVHDIHDKVWAIFSDKGTTDAERDWMGKDLDTLVQLEKVHHDDESRPPPAKPGAPKLSRFELFDAMWVSCLVVLPVDHPTQEEAAEIVEDLRRLTAHADQIGATLPAPLPANADRHARFDHRRRTRALSPQWATATPRERSPRSRSGGTPASCRTSMLPTRRSWRGGARRSTISPRIST